MLKFISKKNLLIPLFIFFTFFLGFILQENSAGGGKIDNIHITNNFILFENNNFFEIQWSLYSSSTLPIYYFIAGIFYQYNPLFIKIFNFILSLCSIYLFYLILKIKFNVKKNNNNNILILSCLPLLSPYFRTSTFWGLEEITAYFFFLCSTFFFYISSKKKIELYKYLAIFFSILAFFSRLNLIFLPIFFLFSYLKKNHSSLSLGNLKKIFFFIIIISPSLYFFYKFKSDMPGGGNRINFQISNLPIIFSIIFLYLIPLILVNINILKEQIKGNKYIYSIIIIFIFFILLISFGISPKYEEVGGGFFYKIFFKLNIFDEYFTLKKYLFVFFSTLGIFFSMIIAIKNIFFIFYLIFTTIVFINIDIVFQEYFDPLIFFIITLFTNLITKKNLSSFTQHYLLFSIILLVLSIIHKHYLLRI
jgi:hypothetical protein